MTCEFIEATLIGQIHKQPEWYLAHHSQIAFHVTLWYLLYKVTSRHSLSYHDVQSVQVHTTCRSHLGGAGGGSSPYPGLRDVGGGRTYLEDSEQQ